MKTLKNFKWLMAILLLCVSMTTRADDMTLDIASLTTNENTTTNWSSGGSGTVNSSNSSYVDLTLGDWDAFGWTAWNSPWNLKSYSKVVVSYTDLSFTEGASEYNHYLQLCIGDNTSTASVQGTAEATGTIEYVIADHSTGSYWDDGTEYTATIDYENIDQIVIQAGAACTVTITAVTFVESDGETTEESSETLILNDYNEANWEDTTVGSETYGQDSGSISYDNDANTATLTFTRGWGGLGWTKWNGSTGWNLSEYDAIEVTYESLSGTSIKLYVQDGTDWTGDSSEEYTSASGTITFVFDEHETLDYTDIANIVIQAGSVSGSASVTITSVKFIKYSSGGDSTEDTNPYISIKDGTAYLNLTSSFTNWQSGAGDTIVNDTSEVPNTAELEFKADAGTWGGLGWNYDNLDITDYYQLVVNYTAEATQGATAVDVVMLLYSGQNAIQVSDTENNGTLKYHIYTSSSDSFDPSQITSIVIQTGVPATVSVTSIQLLTKDQVSVEDEDLLYSNFNLWTENTENYKSDTDSDDVAPFTIHMGSNWNAGQWWFGDVDEDEYWGVELKIKTSAVCKFRLAVQYWTGEYDNSSGEDEKVIYTEKFTIDTKGDNDTEQTLLLPFLGEYDHYVEEVFLQCGTDDNDDWNGCDITVTSAKLIGTTNQSYQGDYVTILTVNKQGYATYYNSQSAYEIPLGMTGTTITGIGLNDEDSEDKYGVTTHYSDYPLCETLRAGTVVAAGVPLLLKGTADEPDVTYTAFLTTGGTTPGENWLHGSDGPITAEEMKELTDKDNPDDYYYFKFSYRDSSKETVGFYYGAADGVAFDMSTSYNKAWLAVPKTEIKDLNTEEDGTGVKFTGFSIGGIEENGNEDSTTGITAVPAETVKSVSDGVIYNLQGMRVNDMSKKGIYIVNGKKTIKQ